MSNVFTPGMEIHERRLTTQVLLLCIYTANTTPTHCWVLQHTAILLLLLPVTTAKAPALKKERSHGSGLRACQHHHHHQHPLSLQDHTAPHINPLSSSSRAQKDVGRPWQVSQNLSGHTCTTKYFFADPNTKRTEQNRTEQKKMWVQSCTSKSDTCPQKKKKKSNRRRVLNTSSRFFIFIRSEKPLKHKSDISEHDTALHWSSANQ